MKTTDTNTAEQLTELGFSLEILSGPTGGVDDGDDDGEKAWPHIAYNVALAFKGKRVLTSPYKLGVGHVDPKKVRTGTTLSAMRFQVDDESLLMTWQSKPHAQFKDKKRWALVAEKLAILQKVEPTLPDVLHSLLMDGEAFFNAQGFEDWARDLGYDADSRKAESIYRACDAIGRKLAATVPQDVLDKAREAVRDL